MMREEAVRVAISLTLFEGSIWLEHLPRYWRHEPTRLDVHLLSAQSEVAAWQAPVAEIFLGSVATKEASLLVAFTAHRAMRCIEI